MAGCGKSYQPVACDQLDPEEYVETKDPLERLNRATFRFNLSFDKAIARPVAVAYRDGVPKAARDRVTDFSRYLREPRNFVSALLQGRAEESATVLLRFGTNTVFGGFGIYDMASRLDMKYENHDFGTMLGRWGVGEGTYVVFPFLGPSNFRDSTGSLIHYTQTNVENRISDQDARTAYQLAQAVNTRANLLPVTDIVDEQLDPYLFVRESYRQNRLHAICNP